MSRSALQRLQTAVVADAPATVDMTLPEALADTARRLGVSWDKGVLDGYPGEGGLSPSGRLLTIIGACVIGWTPIVALFATRG